MAWRSARLGLCAAGLIACGGGSNIEIDPNETVVGTRWNAVLATPRALVGAMQIKGTGWMAPEDDSTRIRAFTSIQNAVPGGRHPWHVHVGQCGADGGIFGPPEAYKPLEVKGNGTAESTAELEMVFPRSGQYYINVHASPNNMGTIIACGNLAPPSR